MYELVFTRSCVHIWFYWLLLSLDMIGMIGIIPYWIYPYVLPSIPRCYKPLVCFSWFWFMGWFMVIGWVFHNLILLYRTTHPRIYLYFRKWNTCKNYSFHCIITVQQPTNETQPFQDIIQGISTMYHWRLETL